MSHSSRFRSPVAGLMLLCLITAHGVRAAGPVRVDNPAVPLHGSTDVHLEEIWRAGGVDDDMIFGLVTQVRTDAAGNLYVMDAQLSQVHVYAPDGRLLRTLFAEGEGPGEIRGPRDIVLLDDGRVGAVQEQPGKLVYVDALGNPAGQLRVGGRGTSHGGLCQTFSAFSNGTSLLMAGFIQSPGTEPGRMQQTSFLSSFDAEGDFRHDFARTDNQLVMTDFVFDEMKHLATFWWNAGVAADGRVFVAPHHDRYEIQVLSPEGQLEKTITRTYTPWPRSQADRDHITDMVRAIYHGAPFQIGVKPAATEPVILYLQRGLRVRPDGSLQVLTTRGVREPGNGAMATFDVFDTEGRFTRQVNVHGPWNGRTDGIFFVDQEHAVVVTGFADAMLTQFTGGHMTLDLAGESGSVEVVYCHLQ